MTLREEASERGREEGRDRPDWIERLGYTDISVCILDRETGTFLFCILHIVT